MEGEVKERCEYCLEDMGEPLEEREYKYQGMKIGVEIGTYNMDEGTDAETHELALHVFIGESCEPYWETFVVSPKINYCPMCGRKLWTKNN